MAALFMSYRRNDVPDMVGRLHDRIEARFGPGSLFRDVDAIRAGSDFRQALEQALSESRALIAIMGPSFVAELRRTGTDFVVEEIGRALERSVPVIPVLVHGAAMPALEQLPPRISQLVNLQACRLRGDPDFRGDARRILDVLAPLLQAGPAAPTATLLLVSGPLKGTTYRLDKERTLLGRDPSCDVHIDAGFASLFHAALLSREGIFYCEDLSSSNGTFMNGARVSGRQRLNDGDLIHIGNCVLRFCPAAGAPATARVRVTLHEACFVATGTVCCFINVTNVSAEALELTHVWIEATPSVFPMHDERPLPKRLQPQESWETWIPSASLPAELATSPALFQSARARLSSGEVLSSVRNDSVPDYGRVPGGPIRTVP
jgi:hypothetical protein